MHSAGVAVTNVSVGDRALTAAELGGDGVFELSVPEVRGGTAWSVQLRATLADGTTVAREVALGPCLDRSALAAAPGGLTPDVGAPYGEWVTPDQAKTLHHAGATLEIPAGAVSEPVRITIRPLTRDQASPVGRGLVNVVPGSGSFRFGPAGLRFKRPVRLTLPFDREGLPPAATTRSISTLYFDEPVGLWRAIPKVADASDGVMVSETEHFTEFMNATLPAPDAPGPKNSLPDEMNGIELGSPSAGVDLIAPPAPNPQRTEPKHPAALLQGFTGYLQGDGYAGYAAMLRGGDDGERIVPEERRLGCGMHIRAKFEKAAKGGDARAAVALAYFKAIYRIEAACKAEALPMEARLARRQELSLPVVDELYQWIHELHLRLVPNTPLYVATQYAINQEAAWRRCFTDGRFEIDNGEVERQLRRVALGRKNYLFAGSDEGAKRLALGYTIFGSCRMHGANPLAWATDVIGKLQAGWPRERLDELLPAAWARASLGAPAAGDVDAS
ncbi:transposase [Sorangium sp. So ce1151]